MTTTRTAVAALALAAITLTGCAGRDGTIRPAAPAPSTLPAEPVATSDEDAYLDLLTAEYPEITAYMPADELVEIGHNTCTAIDRQGVEVALLIAYGSAQGDPYAERMLGYVVGASVASFCPEHIADLEAYT